MSWGQSKITHRCVKDVGNCYSSDCCIYMRIHRNRLMAKTLEFRSQPPHPHAAILTLPSFFSVCWLVHRCNRSAGWTPSTHRKCVKLDGIGFKKKGTNTVVKILHYHTPLSLFSPSLSNASVCLHIQTPEVVFRPITVQPLRPKKGLNTLGHFFASWDNRRSKC